MAKKKSAKKTRTASSRTTKKKASKKSSRVAKKKTSRKKVAKKKTAAKKRTTKKKTTARKAGAKKKATKKRVAKKTAKKKATKKNTARKKTAKKRVAAKKKTAKKVTRKNAVRKKVSAKKAPSRKKKTKAAGEVVERSHGSDPINLHHHALSKAEIKELRAMLIARLRQLVDDIDQMKGEAFSEATKEISTNHLADSSSIQYDQDFTLSMIESESEEVGAIKLALDKIDGRNSMQYGVCEATGEWISIERLRAKPYARLTVSAIEKFEAEGGGEKYGIYPERRF